MKQKNKHTLSRVFEGLLLAVLIGLILLTGLMIRPVSVSREISKIHEETVRGTLEEVIAHFTVNEPKGEIVIVLAGLKDKKDKETGTEV